MSSGPQVGVTGFGHPHRSSQAPAADISALGRCVGVPVAEFAAEHWARRPLLTRAADDFTDLFGTDAVDELVSRRGLRTPFLRMAKDGSVLASARFTRSGGSGATIEDQVADDRVLAAMADGATLVLQALHRTWPPLVQFGAQLSQELGHPVQINSYVTPPQNQGFAAHYDTHDVFVLQIAGRKRWQIHAPVLPDPLPAQAWDLRRDEVAARAAEEPLLDVVLQPGDALYLPRGYLHSAVAQGELAVHLTVGVHPITRYAVARELLGVAGRSPQLRASLPMGADLADPDVLRPHVRDVAAALATYSADLDEESVEAVSARIGATLTGLTRPEPISPVAQLAAAATLTGPTVLRARAGLRYSLRLDADSVLLGLLDKTITLPLAVQTAVKVVLAGDPFAVTDLPGLEPDEQLVVARRLIREGVVVPDAAPS